MKKNSLNYRDEIDLTKLFKIIYKEKVKIFLIMFISIVAGIAYITQEPISIRSSLEIKISKDTEFTKFLPIYNSLYDDLINPMKNQEIPEKKKKVLVRPNQISETMLSRFVKEILDYEELIEILSNNSKLRKEISRYDLDKQQQFLYIYAQSLSIEQPNKDIPTYNLSFVWDNDDESKYIINNLLKKVKKNFETRIFKELDDLLVIKKRKITNDIMKRAIYLKEQSEIAKELGIQYSQIDSVNLSQSNVSFNITTSNVPYYLRGFKTIDKEIELLKAREYTEITNIQEDINFLKQTNLNWVDYNINFLKSTKENKTNLYLMISIAIGFVLITLYVFIIYMSKYRMVYK